SPDDDPLAVLVIIDFLCIKSKQYDYLSNFYDILEESKHLSLMPNFCFSLALARFYQDRGESDMNSAMLQEALLKFPNVLRPLLDKCQIESDAKSAACKFFYGSHKDGQGLEYLTRLYISRSFIFWKEEDVLHWLERNVLAVIDRLESDETAKALANEFTTIRKKRFTNVPINLLRHIVLSDSADVQLTIPEEFSNTPIFQFDPFPPADSRCSYKRPQRQPVTFRNHPLALIFFRSMFPGYTPIGTTEEEFDAAMELPQPDFLHMMNRVREYIGLRRNELNNMDNVPNENDPDRPDEEWEDESFD
ncbi:unnamed protein product, partial [Soboliphyme baturini]|uniref:Transcription factor 25 n=1 Tax=Soboliphyme baturini TaxID=241478 RepID=A0A183IRD6_9BILA